YATTAAKKENELRSSQVHSRADNEQNPQQGKRKAHLGWLGERQANDPRKTRKTFATGYRGGRSLGVVPLYYLFLGEGPKEPNAASFQNIEANYHFYAPIGILPLDRNLRRHQPALAKSLQYQQGFFQGQALEGRPPDRDLRCGGDQAGTSEEITADEWDNYIRFWNDPKNLARAAQNRQNRQKSVVISQTGITVVGSAPFEMRW
ncbi:hypothetical protein Tco_0561393, partial [Tanacetum coccineum]